MTEEQKAGGQKARGLVNHMRKYWFYWVVFFPLLLYWGWKLVNE